MRASGLYLGIHCRFIGQSARGSNRGRSGSNVAKQVGRLLDEATLEAGEESIELVSDGPVVKVGRVDGNAGRKEGSRTRGSSAIGPGGGESHRGAGGVVENEAC